MAPLVSIIIPCFNRASYLEKCVKSVIKQTFTDLECILVDDGSTDNTRSIAEGLMSIDSRIKYFYKENGGVSSARNFGIEKAKGAWIQCLDPDDWIHEDKTRFQLSYLDSIKDENTIFYCDYERVHLDSEHNIIQRDVHIVGSLKKEQLIERLLLPDFLATSPFPLLQQCLLIKKDIFKDKIFDIRLKAMEDRTFGLDMLDLGINFVYTPLVGAFYTKHTTNMTNDWNYLQNQYISFYEIVKNRHNDFCNYCQPALAFFINEAVRDRDKNSFDRLSKLIDFPVDLFDGKLQIKNLNFLRVFYWIRQVIPDFILYEKFRGTRSKRIMSIFSIRLN